MTNRVHNFLPPLVSLNPSHPTQALVKALSSAHHQAHSARTAPTSGAVQTSSQIFLQDTNFKNTEDYMHLV